MKTHNERRQWLEQHGWKADDIPRSQNIKGIGQSAHFESHETTRGELVMWNERKRARFAWQ